MENKEIRRKILEYIYQKDEERPHYMAERDELIKFLNIDERQVDNNVLYLGEKGYLRLLKTIGALFRNAQITSYGKDLVEDSEQFNIKFPIQLTQNIITNSTGTVIGDGTKQIIAQNPIKNEKEGDSKKTINFLKIIIPIIISITLISFFFYFKVYLIFGWVVINPGDGNIINSSININSPIQIIEEPKKIQEIILSTNYNESKKGSNIVTGRYKKLILFKNFPFKGEEYQINNININKKEKDQNKLEDVEIVIQCNKNIKILGYINTTDVKPEMKSDTELILNINKLGPSSNYNYSIGILIDFNESIETENCIYSYSYSGLDRFTNDTELSFKNEVNKN